MIIYLVLLLILSITPMIWLNYVFSKNDKILINMPFNGLQFGQMIINEKGLKVSRLKSHSQWITTIFLKEK